MGKSTFKLVQPGFISPIISRYLTHSYVTRIVMRQVSQRGQEMRDKYETKSSST